MNEPASERRLVAVGGRIASGKSTVAREVAARLHALVIETDRVRDDLLAEVDDGSAGLRTFASDVEDRVYLEAIRRAESALEAGERVVLDGCFALASQRRRARSLARRIAVPFLFVECQASGATVDQRLAEREARSDRGGWRDLHDALVRQWEPIEEFDAAEYVRVRTDGPVDEAVSAVLEKLPPSVAPALAQARIVEAPPPPAAVTFDCWNTLLVEEDWALAHAVRVTELRSAAREAGVEVSEEVAAQAFDAAWERHMRLWREGRASGAHEVALWGLAQLGLVEPHPAHEHLVRNFEEASHSSRVEALDGARATLEALAAAGIPCALVCDTGLTPGRVVRRHLDRLGLLGGLAAESFSDEVGVPKPDPRAFRAALDPLKIAPERALHVGDLRRTDVAGARRLGMVSVRIRASHDDSSELPDADFVVDSHAGLIELLGLRASDQRAGRA